MPKGRYAIMRRLHAAVGHMGLDMMLRTCTVQVNLDFGDEADMVEKLRVSLALQPLATALFANSPFTEGKPNGYRTLRGKVWTDTDPDRTGIPAVVFEDGFGFERFADWVLDVPMYFVMREGRYIDAAGHSVPRLPGGPRRRRCRANRDDGRLGRPRDHGLHRCAAEALPRDARRGCRQRRPILTGAAGLLGRAALRRRGAEGGARR